MWRSGVFLPKAGTLGHTEAVLFVDHHKSEIVELHIVLDHGVRAYEYVQRAVGQLRVYQFAFLLAGRAGEQFHVYPDRCRHLRYGVEVLRCEYFGRSHQAGLCAVVDGYEHAQQGHECLAASNVALQQPVHLPARTHVGAYLLDDPFLCPGQLERQTIASRRS